MHERSRALAAYTPRGQLEGASDAAPGSVPSGDPSAGGTSPIAALVAGIVAAPLIGLAIVTSSIADEASRDVQASGEYLVLAEVTVTGPIDVLDALNDERAAAVAYMTGTEAIVQPPVADNVSARQAVDGAIASLRATVNQHGGNIEGALRPVLDDIEPLAAVRDLVDSAPQAERTPDNAEAAGTTFEGYRTVIEAYEKAQERLAVAIDNPELSQGATLARLGTAQSDRVDRLARGLTLAALDERPGAPGSLTLLRLEVRDLRRADQVIDATAIGDYRALAEAVFADETVRRLGELTDRAVETGTVDAAGVSAVATRLGAGPSAYATFQQATIDRVRELADDVAATADATQRRYGLAAAVATIAAAAAALLAIALAAMSLRRGGSPSPEPPGRPGLAGGGRSAPPGLPPGSRDLPPAASRPGRGGPPGPPHIPPGPPAGAPPGPPAGAPPGPPAGAPPGPPRTPA